MRVPPTRRQLWSLPPLYATAKIPLRNKIIRLHFTFPGDCHWYAVEFDGRDTFFGFAILHGDLANADWGYFSLGELIRLNVYGLQVVRDLHWTAKPARDVELIAKAHPWITGDTPCTPAPSAAIH